MAKPGAQPLAQVCQVAVYELRMTGAAISLLVPDDIHETLATADQESAALADVEFTVGEGPGWDSCAAKESVHAWDLHRDVRWPVYCSLMNERGIRAVFAIPIMAGPTQLGVLELFRAAPGRLLGSDLRTACDLATAAADLMTTPEVLQMILPDLGTSRVPVYVAQGMLRAQLDCTLPEAMARLRAHAYATNRTLMDVARDVTSHTLVLQRD